MKNIIPIIAVVLAGLILPGAGLASDGFRPITDLFTVTPRSDGSGQTLHSVCTDEESGLRMACGPDWQARPVDGGLQFRISAEPPIDMQTSYRAHQRRTGIRFGWAELQALHRYAGWFDMAQRHECGRKIVQAKGYLAAAPRARAFDYYLADWEGLYAVQFTVEKTVEFDRYRGLFEEIIDSVEFVTENRDTVNFRAPNYRQCQTITRE